jgi:hypothetical protein
MRSQNLTLDTVIDTFRTTRALALPAIELTLNISLTKTDESPSFLFYEGGRVPLADAVVSSVGFRTPVGVPGTEGGPLLVIKIDTSPARRVSRKTILERFGPLILTGVPRGRSSDEQAYWSAIESVGKVSFGFAEPAPDSLASVVFSRNH